MDPKALTELLPDWKNLNSPVKQEVKSEEVAWLSKGSKTNIPGLILPPYLDNHGNYIVKLGEVAHWLGEQAKAKGVEILEGLGGAKLILENENDPAKLKVLGVQCTDTGLKKDGTPGDSFTPGARIIAKVTVLAEGVRGSLTKPLLKAANLEAGKTPQKFSTGVKEIWELLAGVFPAGKVVHTLGFPLQGLGATFPGAPFGGSFIYGLDETHIAVGLVVGLDYNDPLLDPHQEFQ
jgi:electron-transferring-flavoprotein dehydrogenase